MTGEIQEFAGETELRAGFWQRSWLALRSMFRISSDPTYKYKRVTELFIGAEALIIVVLIENWFRVGIDRHMSTIIIFATMFVAVCMLHWRFYKGHEASSLRAALWSGTFLLSLTCWTEVGLYDTSATGYCIIMVYAGILETRRQFYALVCSMFLSLFGLGIINEFGLVHFILPFTFGDVLDYIMTYALIAYSIDALAQDMNIVLERYKDENEKVRQSEAEISRMVHHDLLTGLPNRAIAERDFAALSTRPGAAGSVFFIDLDHFKAVNDTLGHAVGDELLKAVTAKLLSVVGSQSTLSRVGGDEFLLVSDQGSREAVENIANRIRIAGSEPMEMGGRMITPTFSIGISRFPEDGIDFETLSRKADIALYSAKAAGRNIFRIYDESMNSKSLSHLWMAGRLRDAISHSELRVYYQPKISLKTGQVEGAEALLRWFPESGGQISPDEFIPLAESTGLIDEIGRWVLKQACRQCRTWQKSEFPGLKMSVNVSPAQFKRGNLLKAVDEALQESGLDATCLELELTESILLHDEFDIGGQIAGIRALGVTFSIDDFGKGYSNLGYLGKLDIGTLKIDRHFVAHMLDTDKDRALVGAIFAIANALNLKTVAEGVETEESIETLKAFGCSSAQGFYWSRPVDPAGFEAYAAHRDETRHTA